jgi:hypothetical protein
MNQVDPLSTPDPVVELDMDVIESPTGIQERAARSFKSGLSGKNEEACTNVRKAIELAVQTVCGGDDEPIQHKR